MKPNTFMAVISQPIKILYLLYELKKVCYQSIHIQYLNLNIHSEESHFTLSQGTVISILWQYYLPLDI